MTVRGVVNSMRQASAAMSDRVPRIQRRQSASGSWPFPCGNGALRHLLAAPCDGRRREAGTAGSSRANEIASIHDASPSWEAIRM